MCRIGVQQDHKHISHNQWFNVYIEMELKKYISNIYAKNVS